MHKRVRSRITRNILKNAPRSGARTPLQPFLSKSQKTPETLAGIGPGIIQSPDASRNSLPSIERNVGGRFGGVCEPEEALKLLGCMGKI